jgi:hypothetical protein
MFPVTVAPFAGLSMETDGGVVSLVAFPAASTAL